MFKSASVIWQLGIITRLETRVVDNLNRSSNVETCSGSLYYLVEAADIDLWQMNLKTAKTQIISSALNA